MIRIIIVVVAVVVAVIIIIIIIVIIIIIIINITVATTTASVVDWRGNVLIQVCLWFVGLFCSQDNSKDLYVEYNEIWGTGRL